MTTLIVEDGSGVPGANTYVSAQQFVDYCTARGFTMDTNTAVQYIVLAMDYIEQVDFIGMKTNQNQSLQWPRQAAFLFTSYYGYGGGLTNFGYYGYGFYPGQIFIDGYPVATNVIPNLLQLAEMECALQVFKGNDPNQDIQRKTLMEKVGSVEVQYSPNSSSYTIPQKINKFLRKLLKNGGAGNFGVSR